MFTSDAEKVFCFHCMHYIFEENLNKNQRDEKKHYVKISTKNIIRKCSYEIRFNLSYLISFMTYAAA